MASTRKKKTQPAATKPTAAARKPAAPGAADSPAADPRVADLKEQLSAVDAQLRSGTLDLTTKVKLTNEKKILDRRIADLAGDKPFLTKVPKHKQAA